MPMPPIQDEKFAALFERAAEPIIGSFANNFTRRLRFRDAQTDYEREFKAFSKVHPEIWEKNK